MLPFSVHWYEGVSPPFTGVAVYVMLVPAQTVPEGLAAMLTLTGRFGFTVNVSVLERAGDPVAQVAFEVSVQVTRSPVVSDEFE